MDEIARLVAANAIYAQVPPSIHDARPSRRLAVITCMDARIDVFAALGLRLGEAHIIRNAGGRITEDSLRSLALSSKILGVDTVIILQHTRCGLEAKPEDELRRQTGANIEFLSIDDHTVALKEDIAKVVSTPYLDAVHTVAGFVYDVDTGLLNDQQMKQR